MKYSKYFGAKWRRLLKVKVILAPKGASHLKNENIRCDNKLERLALESSSGLVKCL
jgi:hypothetical protein